MAASSVGGATAAICVSAMVAGRPAARARVGRLLHLALSRHLPGYRLPRSLAMLGGLPADEDPSG